MQFGPAKDHVELVRRLSVKPAAVFAAFADPTLVSLWLKPSRDIRLEVVDYDFRPGGIYRFAYHVAGLPVMRVNGAFALIDPPRAVAFSWNIEPPDVHAGIQSEVRISIRPAAGGSEIKVQHTKLDQDGASARHEDGWNGALFLLQQLLEEA